MSCRFTSAVKSLEKAVFGGLRAWSFDHPLGWYASSLNPWWLCHALTEEIEARVVSLLLLQEATRKWVRSQIKGDSITRQYRLCCLKTGICRFVRTWTIHIV